MEYFAGGEKVGALDVFDEVASGNSSCYISADYYTGKHPGLAYWTSVPFRHDKPLNGVLGLSLEADRLFGTRCQENLG